MYIYIYTYLYMHMYMYTYAYMSPDVPTYFFFFFLNHHFCFDVQSGLCGLCTSTISTISAWGSQFAKQRAVLSSRYSVQFIKTTKSHEIPIFPKGNTQVKPHSIPMETIIFPWNHRFLPWNPSSIPIKSYEIPHFPMIFPWFSHGFPMAFTTRTCSSKPWTSMATAWSSRTASVAWIMALDRMPGRNMGWKQIWIEIWIIYRICFGKFGN